MIVTLFGLLLPTAIVWRGLDSRGGHPASAAVVAFDVGAAMVLAVGLTSCLWFMWLQWVGTPGWGYLAFETAVLLVTARSVRRLAAGAAPTAEPSRTGAAGAQIAGMPVHRLIIAVLLLLAATWLASFAANTTMHPHGSWDAVAIWNLHARFLAAGAARWSELMRDGAVCAYHGDYPLLVPVTVARLWTLSGATAPATSALVSFWFAAAVALLCGGLVGCLRGGTQALLAAATLLGTSFFIEQSSVQYADLPLAACMLAATAALARYEVGGRVASRWLIVAGAATALAAWTKNEGVLFVAVVVGVRVARALRSGHARAAFGREAPLVAGVLPGLLVVAYFKFALAPENDLVAAQGLSATVSRVFAAGRYARITLELISNGLRMLKSLFFVLPLYYLLMGPTGAPAGRRGAGWILVIYGLVLIGYFGVYVTTPQPLEWHLNTSARRLLLQLWPGFLAAFFLRVAAPEERLG